MSSQIIGEVKCIDIVRKRGDTKSINVTVKDKNGVTVNITGSSFTLSVSPTEKPDTANYVFQSTGAILDALGGKVSFPINTAAANNVGKFFYDIEMVLSGGEICTILQGKFTMNQDITK